MRISNISIVTVLVTFCSQGFAADLPRREGARDENHPGIEIEYGQLAKLYERGLRGSR